VPSITAGLLAWAAVIAASHLWGRAIVESRPATRIFVPPLVARFDPSPLLGALLPLAVAALVVAYGPRLASLLGWRALLAVAFATAALWAVSLALTDGVVGLIRPMEFPNDYRQDIDLVAGPGDFLSHFTERIDRYNQHVRAHPPGMVLLLWSMDGLGLRGAGWEAALVVVGGASVVPAAMVALKEVSGETRARTVAPFLAMAPAAVWVASSADALFAGVGAWAVALMVVSTGRSGRAAAALAFGGGVAFGAALFLSYGLALLVVPPLVVAIVRRRLLPLLFAGAGALVVVGLFALAGFWWIDGLQATLGEYRASVARIRPYSYFLLGNLAAFGIAVGPATAVALARLRDRGTWILVAGGLAMVAVADVTGLSKGEVERIWLPFVPWVMMATSELPPRVWLALNAAFAVVVELALNTTW
jgi:methylthioxylose transferase